VQQAFAPVAPPHAGAVEADADEMANGSLDDAGRDVVSNSN
jgi:hypothetical protein